MENLWFTCNLDAIMIANGIIKSRQPGPAIVKIKQPGPGLVIPVTLPKPAAPGGMAPTGQVEGQ